MAGNRRILAFATRLQFRLGCKSQENWLYQRSSFLTFGDRTSMALSTTHRGIFCYFLLRSRKEWGEAIKGRIPAERRYPCLLLRWKSPLLSCNLVFNIQWWCCHWLSYCYSVLLDLTINSSITLISVAVNCQLSNWFLLLILCGGWQLARPTILVMDPRRLPGGLLPIVLEQGVDLLRKWQNAPSPTSGFCRQYDPSELGPCFLSPVPLLILLSNN